MHTVQEAKHTHAHGQAVYMVYRGNRVYPAKYNIPVVLTGPILYDLLV